MDDEYIEQELDAELMEEFSSKLEKAVNAVCKKHKNKDPRVELMTVLVSFGAQVADDIGIEIDNFTEIAHDIFADTNEEEPEKADNKDVN